MVERDAYAAAYEASLKHFDRWSQKKNVKRQSSSAKHVESVDSNELTNKIES